MISTVGLSIKALKKEPFSGSHCGMHYYLTVSGDVILTYIYPEPWCFEATPEDQKIKKEFSFTQEGLDAAISWLNETFQDQLEKWEELDRDKMKLILSLS